MSSFTRKAGVVVAVLAILLCSSQVLLAEEDEGVRNASTSVMSGAGSGMISHVDADLDELIVIDRITRSIFYYRIGEKGLRLVGRRNLDADVLKNVKSETRPGLVWPESDVAGEDPPGVPRLEGSVRVSSSYRLDGDKNIYSAGYLLKLERREAIAAAISLLDGWAITYRNVQHPNASPWAWLQAKRGAQKIEVRVSSWWGEGAMIHVEVRQPR